MSFVATITKLSLHISNYGQLGNILKEHEEIIIFEYACMHKSSLIRE